MARKDMSFDDFFGINDDDDFGLEEPVQQVPVKAQNIQQPVNTKGNKKANNKKNVNKTNNVNTQATPNMNTAVKPPKKHKALKIILLVILLALAIMALLGKLGEMGILGKAGIIYEGETSVYGLTLDELGEKEFSVQNKTKKDISMLTDWTLNDGIIAQGSNSCIVPKESWNFGENVLIATNGEDTITFLVNVAKSSDGTASYHNYKSTVNVYPSGLYSQFNHFDSVKPADIVSMELYEGNALANGKYQREQRLNNMKLTVEEIQPYSIFLCEPMGLSNNQRGIYNFYIDGNMNDVSTATVSVKLDEQYGDNLQIYIQKDGKLSQLDSSEYKYYNGTYIINIKRTGNYIIDHSNKTTDSSNVLNIAIIKASDTDQFTYLETAKNIVLKESDDKYASKATEEFYDSFINALVEDAGTFDNVKVNAFVYDNAVATQIYNNGEKVDKVYDYTFSTIDNAFVDFTDTDSRSYGNSSVIIYYLKEDSGDASSKIAKSIKELGELGIDTTAVIVNSKVSGIKSLEEIPNNVNVIEMSDNTGNLAFLNSCIGTINQKLRNFVPQTMDINGEEKNVQLLADSGISYDKMSKFLCGYHTDLDIGNSYGYVLLEKLAQSNMLMSSWFNGSSYLKSGHIEPVNKLNTGLVQTILSEDAKTAMMTDRSKLSFEEMQYIANVLTYSRFNSAAESSKNVQSLMGGTCINSVITELCNRITSKGMLAELSSDGEYVDILVTKLYKDIDSCNTYYLEFYNPTVSREPQIMKLNLTMGVMGGVEALDKTYTIEYGTQYSTFDSLFVIDDVEIFVDNEQVF